MYANLLQIKKLKVYEDLYLANELCTLLITWALLKAKPFILASKVRQNSLNSVSVGPNSKSGCLQFSRILRIAWVAQALFITYKTKKKYANIKPRFNIYKVFVAWC